MTMIMMEGHSSYGGPLILGRKMAAIPVVSTTFVTSRSGVGEAHRLGVNSASAHHALPTVINPTIIVGFAWQMDQNDAQDHKLFKAYRFDVEQWSLGVSYPFGLEFESGGVVLAQVDNVFRLKDWIYIEIKCTVNGSTGSFEVRVDGVSIMSETNQDTQNGVDTIMDGIRWSTDFNPSSEDISCDIVVMDDNGGVNDDFLGDIVVETLLPDGDGDRNDFTRVGGGSTNSDAVDDGVAPDDDATYNHSATVGDDELYTFNNLTVQHDTVHCVSVRNHCRKEDAGQRTVRALLRSNVTEVEGADFTPGFTYRIFDEIYEVDPDTASAWITAGVDALEAGFTITA